MVEALKETFKIVVNSTVYEGLVQVYGKDKASRIAVVSDYISAEEVASLPDIF